MKKYFSIFILFCLIILAGLGASYQYAASHDFFFPQITTLVKENTGYTVDKTGMLEASLFPYPSLTASGLTLSNPFISPGSKLLSTERITLGIRWLSLFQLQLLVDVKVDSADIFLHINKTGTANWSTPELENIREDLPVNLGNIEILQSRIRFINSRENEGLGLALDKFDIEFTGDIRQIVSGTSSDLTVSGSLDHLEQLLTSQFPGTRKRDSTFQLGPVTVDASVSRFNKDYLLEEAKLETLNGEIKASVTGKLNDTGEAIQFNLTSMVNGKDFSRLSALFPEAMQSNLKDISVSASTKIDGTNDRFSFTDTEIELFHNSSKLNFSGKITQLPDDPVSDITLHYSLDKTVELENYYPELKGLQLRGPLELTGLIHTTGSKINIHALRLQAEQTDVEGEVMIDLGTSPSRVSVNLESNQFISPLVENESSSATPAVVKPDPNTDTTPESQGKSKTSANELGERFKAYTSALNISTDWIKQLNTSFRFIAAKVQVGDYSQENVTLIIEVREGQFKLVEYELLLDGKPITLNGSINTNSIPPTYELTGTLGGDTLEALLGFQGNLFEGGELNGDFKLESRGVSLGELIENLDGYALISMGPLIIRSSELNLVSSSIWSNVLKGLVNRKSESQASEYECGVLGIDISNGVARIDKSFTMQAQDYNLAGNGTIDLNTGIVDVKVIPKAKKGLGVTISSVIGGFQIRGNMATPDLGLGGGGLISAAIAGYALTPAATAATVDPVTASIVATGILLTGIVDRMTASNYTCENVLKRIERKLQKADSPKP